MRPTLLLSLSLLFIRGSAPLGGAASTQSDRPNPCVGTVERQLDHVTLVSIQGTHQTADGYEKTEARLVTVAPNDSVSWVRDNSAAGHWWTTTSIRS